MPQLSVMVVLSSWAMSSTILFAGIVHQSLHPFAIALGRVAC